MQYTIENGETTRIYEVVYDKAKLEELLNKIIRECSYKVKGQFTLKVSEVIYGYSRDLCYGIRSLPSLLNGDPMYQGVTKVCDDYDGLSRERVFVNGSKVIVPKLASIVASILKDDIESLNLLQAYKDDAELISNDAKLNEKIKESRKIINANEVDVDKLIEILDELKELRNKQKENQYFNVDLLKQYYLEVINSISYELVSETIKSTGPVKKLSMSEMFDKKA